MVDRRHRVLIVDDEHTIADTLGLIFAGNGDETRAAYSAQQALEIIAEWPPDLAILDVVLPKLNGIDLRRLRASKLPLRDVVSYTIGRLPLNN